MNDKIILREIIPYSTKPIEKISDQNNKFKFVCDIEADYIIEYENTLKLTLKDDHREFIIAPQLTSGNILITDPITATTIKENNPEYKIIIINICANELIRLERAKKANETLDSYLKKVSNEYDVYNEFENDPIQYNKMIINNSDENSMCFLDLIYYIKATYTEEIKYFVVGRSYSGKHALVDALIEYFNNY